MKHEKALSSSVDEYLEEMYRCELRGDKITTKRLAQALKISMPSVSGMLRKLKHKGMVAHQPWYSIRLTPKGRGLGLKIYRKHEAIKEFFMLLGLKEKAAAEQACRLEHELSDRALKRIEFFLKHAVPQR